MQLSSDEVGIDLATLAIKQGQLRNVRYAATISCEVLCGEQLASVD